MYWQCQNYSASILLLLSKSVYINTYFNDTWKHEDEIESKDNTKHFRSTVIDSFLVVLWKITSWGKTDLSGSKAIL